MAQVRLRLGTSSWYRRYRGLGPWHRETVQGRQPSQAGNRQRKRCPLAGLPGEFRSQGGRLLCVAIVPWSRWTARRAMRRRGFRRCRPRLQRPAPRLGARPAVSRRPAPGHPGTAANANMPAVLPAAMFPVAPSGLPLLLLSVMERCALLPEAVTPTSYAWVCDLYATKTSRAWRHPKVPVPVESWAPTEGTKVTLCQCPAGKPRNVVDEMAERMALSPRYWRLLLPWPRSPPAHRLGRLRSMRHVADQRLRPPSEGMEGRGPQRRVLPAAVRRISGGAESLQVSDG